VGTERVKGMQTMVSGARQGIKALEERSSIEYYKD